MEKWNEFFQYILSWRTIDRIDLWYFELIIPKWFLSTGLCWLISFNWVISVVMKICFLWNELIFRNVIIHKYSLVYSIVLLTRRLSRWLYSVFFKVLHNTLWSGRGTWSNNSHWRFRNQWEFYSHTQEIHKIFLYR